MVRRVDVKRFCDKLWRPKHDQPDSMNLRFICLLMCLFLLTGLSKQPQAATIKIAVASNFYSTLLTLKPQFEAQSDHQLILINAASGVIYAQVQHGAPYDVFLSADAVRPEQLVNDGLAFSDSLQPYAIGQLVWWQPSLEQVEPLSEQTRFSSISNYGYDHGKVAIANPNFAPYGVAAESVIKRLKLDDQLTLIRGKNVGQAFQFVDSGNVGAGFIAKSLVVHASQQSKLPKYKAFLPLPDEWYPPIKQYMVILKRTNQLPAARAFTEFLTSDAVQEQLLNLGYQTL